jgi:hypothetical protein
VGDEPPPAFRDAAPEILAPLDPHGLVSGHVPAATEPSVAASLTPQHDFGAARSLIMPSLRPVGTQGMPIGEYSPQAVAASGSAHSQPIIDEGPCELPVVYTMAGPGFDVVVNGDHVLSWGVGVTDIQDAAIENLAAWSATAPWTDESSGGRRLISSDTGDGNDAARILLPDVRAHLASELGSGARVLVGLPERHLLLAGALRPDDAEFAQLFADFVVEQSGGADEPIDRRVFELVAGQLVEYAT